MRRLGLVPIAAAFFALALSCAPAFAETTTQYATIIKTFNPKLQDHQTQRLAREVIRDAQVAHIDARLLVALVTVESAWRQSAISRSGARGLGQLMPSTARLLGVNPRDAQQNLFGAAAYLGRLVSEFGREGRSLRLAVAAYNAGPQAIKRAQGIPANGQTPAYVDRVIAIWRALRAKVDDAARALPADTFVVANEMPIAPYDDIVSIHALGNPNAPQSEAP